MSFTSTTSDPDRCGRFADIYGVLRSKELTGKHAAKTLWLLVAPSLCEAPSLIKVGTSAELLGMKKATVRRALAALTDLGYLTRTKPPTGGSAGEYSLGPRACR